MSNPNFFAPRPARRPGFTLIELMIVVGIIALLIGLALPMILKAYKTAGITRSRSDLALIANSLEAYKADFGDYPRFDDDKVGPLNLMSNRGAVLLCRALLGPAPATTASPNLGDGNNGPGFRVRPGGAGRVYGPYVQSDKFKLGGTDATNFTDATLLDRTGNAILYYPATPGASASSTSGSSFIQHIAPMGYAATPPANPPPKPLYNSYDNRGSLPDGASPYAFQFLMGCDPTTGAIATGRTPSYTGPYILWSAGPDGVFGTDANGKTDDIANFDMPANLRK